MVKYAKDKQEKTELRKKIKEFKENVKETFEKEMFERGTIGTIATNRIQNN